MPTKHVAGATPRPGSWRPWLVAGILALLAAGPACGEHPTSPSNPPGGGTPPPGGGGNPIDPGSGVLVGAGDIAVCDAAWVPSAGTVATGKQLEALSGTVFTGGDNAYYQGSLEQYQKCYDPYWGRVKSRTRPAPGNHEYETAGAAGYYSYFGSVAGGATGQGYYSYTVGPWLILSLNSEIPSTASSAQGQWIRGEVASRGNPRCTMAIWHRPLFTSGPNRDQTDMLDLWKVLYELNVDVIVNGHDHLYERFSPQDPGGKPDPSKGIRQFTVGTGGASLYDPVMLHANSEVRIKSFGVIRFTLSDGAYFWEFLPIDATGSSDSGAGQCH